jgi:branched-subunit amino acid transport protein AzlD
MADGTYIATALAVAVAITSALRAAPFALKAALRDSDLVTDIGRWMPLGAVSILAVYCLSSIDASGAGHGIPELTGVAVTVAIHRWRRNAVLSIILGTATCIVLANWILPGSSPGVTPSETSGAAMGVGELRAKVRSHQGDSDETRRRRDGIGAVWAPFNGGTKMGDKERLPTFACTLDSIDVYSA